MNKFIILALFLTLPAHADITYLQETLPGAANLPSGRGYVTTRLSPGYTQVTPTLNGVIDTSRPGYLIGPTIGRDVYDDIGQSRSLDFADERRKQGRPNLD